jgi:HemK-like putative methylase
MTSDETWLLKEKYNGIPSPAFHKDCERLQHGEPLAYVIGWVPFLETRIALDSRPLIPRPETEYWVTMATQEMRERGGVELRVLDLCAGSGCVGIAVLASLPHAQVDFVEIDEAHKNTIEQNLTLNDLDPRRATIAITDLFIGLGGTYDYILSNPPYIDPARDRTQTSVRRYEPAIALYGGKHGVELLTRIITGAHAFLKPQGTLYLEHEPEQSDEVAFVGKEQGFKTETHHDQYGVERFSILRL